MSRVGIGLCALYAAVMIVCLWLSFSSEGDAKGEFVFLQLPIGPQTWWLHKLGFDPLLERLNWVGAYVVIGLPTFVLLYLAGWFIGWLAARRR